VGGERHPTLTEVSSFGKTRGVAAETEAVASTPDSDVVVFLTGDVMTGAGSIRYCRNPVIRRCGNPLCRMPGRM
jgi:hypothetical protein